MFTLQPFCYGLHFVNPDVKINGKYYGKTLLKEELLPDMCDISEYFIFQQDSMPAKETVDFSTETPLLKNTVTSWTKI